MQSEEDYDLVRRHAAQAIRQLTARRRTLDAGESDDLALLRRAVMERMGPDGERIPPSIFLHATLDAIRKAQGRGSCG